MSETKKGQPNPDIKVIPRKTIVRKISEGQEVTGRVKRLADFGAFIDIGVGTDGLVHVSEVAQERVNKPSDVLKVGQEVTAWIKSLDKQRNRISLTLVSPDTRTIADLVMGEVVSGKVTRIENYGIFVDIGVGHDARVHVKEMSHGFLKHPSDMVKIGDEVEAEVTSINRRRGQIDLSMQAVQPEPEAEPKPEEEIEVEEYEGEEEEEAPTILELAFQQAEANRNKKGKKRRKKQWYDDTDDVDDLIQRTLSLANE